MATGIETPSALQSGTRGDSSIARMLQGFIFMAAWMVLLFACAGTAGYVRGWICSVTYFVAMTAIGWIVHRRNPGLFPARAHWRHADTKPFDKIILPLFFFLTILLPTFAGLDVRFHRPSFPFRTVYPALVLSLCAMSLIGWTMVTNPWAESSVRIQTDRGQQVVGSGPYRFVRHPLYLGCMVLYSASAVIFGGFDALLVALILDGLIVLRTELEDRTLQRELSGYQQYAGITRWRLLPGIW